MHSLLPDGYKRPDGSVRQDWRAYIVVLVAVDAAAAAGALTLAYLVRFGPTRDAFASSTVSVDRYVALAAVVLLAWMVFVRVLGLYDRDTLLAGTDEYARVVQASTLVLVGVVMVDFVVESNVVSRGWLVVFWASLVGLAGLARFVARRGAVLARRWGAFKSRLVIVGADDRAIELAEHLHGTDFDVLGFLDDFRPVGASLGKNGWRVLGCATQLDRAEALLPDEVLIVPTAISWESRQAIINAPVQRRFQVRLLATREGTLTSGVKVSHRARVPVYAVEPARVAGFDAAMKRSFDLAVATGLLAMVGPWAALRLAVQAARGRPLLGRHRILGGTDEPFTVYSLAGGSSRVISKLPAAINVLRGQMSIVGPTPIEGEPEARPPELRLMRPGLTPVVRAEEGPADRESLLSIQLDYVRRYSIWRDLQVVWHRVMSARPGIRSKPFEGSTFWALPDDLEEQLGQEPTRAS